MKEIVISEERMTSLGWTKHRREVHNHNNTDPEDFQVAYEWVKGSMSIWTYSPTDLKVDGFHKSFLRSLGVY